MWRMRFELPLVFLMVLIAGANAFADAEEPLRTITVEGKGEVASVPDMAVIVAGVATTEPTVADAIDKNNRAVGSVLSLARNSGVAEKDLQTAGFSVSPRYDRENAGKVAGYSVTNRVQIRFREMDKLGALLDGLIEAGANRIDRVAFSIDDPESVKREARRRAMADAGQRAELYAEEAGGRLGPVISVEENVSGPPLPRATMAMEAQRFSAPSEVPLALGENVTSVQVVVKYQLLF